MALPSFILIHHVTNFSVCFRAKMVETNSIHENLVSTSSNASAEFDRRINDLMTSINGNVLFYTVVC